MKCMSESLKEREGEDDPDSRGTRSKMSNTSPRPSELSNLNLTEDFRGLWVDVLDSALHEICVKQL